VGNNCGMGPVVRQFAAYRPPRTGSPPRRKTPYHACHSPRGDATPAAACACTPCLCGTPRTHTSAGLPSPVRQAGSGSTLPRRRCSTTPASYPARCLLLVTCWTLRLHAFLGWIIADVIPSCAMFGLIFTCRAYARLPVAPLRPPAISTAKHIDIYAFLPPHGRRWLHLASSRLSIYLLTISPASPLLWRR